MVSIIYCLLYFSGGEAVKLPGRLFMASGKGTAMPLWATASRDKTHKLKPASLIKCFGENVTSRLRRRDASNASLRFFNQADRTPSIVNTAEEGRLITATAVM